MDGNKTSLELTGNFATGTIAETAHDAHGSIALIAKEQSQQSDKLQKVLAESGANNPTQTAKVLTDLVGSDAKFDFELSRAIAELPSANAAA